MTKIATYNFERYSKVFDVTDKTKEYFFIQVESHPYIEEPYRAESYAIGYLKEGSISVQTGLKTTIVSSPAIISLGPSVIRSFKKDSEKMKMDIVFFKSSFFLQNQANVFLLNRFSFFDNDQQHFVKLEESEESIFKNIFVQIKDIFQRKSIYESEIFRSYLYILLYESEAVFSNYKPDVRNYNPMVEKFRHLLSTEFLRQRSVGFYADRLNVSRKYLTEILKKNTGKTASDLIDEAVLLEAKVLLSDRSLTISQISDQLHFSDQSVFGKFFKINTERSPLDYRKNL